MPRAESHARVDRLRLQPGRVQHPHRLERVGEQQPVDHEAGHVGHLDRRPAEHRTQRAKGCPRLLGGRLREGQLHQGHPLHGVEHVHPREALGTGAGLAQLADRQRRRGRGQQRVIGQENPQAAQQVGFDRPVLRHRFHDDRAVTERVELGDHLRRAVQALPRTGGGIVAAGPHDRVHVPARQPRQTARDHTASGYPKPDIGVWLTHQSIE